MKQILLGGDGNVQLAEVPVPARVPDSILVANAFSVISAGTEGSALANHGGWLGAIEKIGKNRDKVGLVWQMIQKQGFQATAGVVSTRLKGVNPLGYSCAGVVAETDSTEAPFSLGDRVACMGTGFATHSEYVVVPRNLVARVPDSVSLKDASFGALACIALQGIRRLELTPGESVGVIGLGLIGQLTIRLLRALGYFVVGFDLDETRVKFAKEYTDIAAWSPSSRTAERAVADATGGKGLDGVIIAAASTSSEPLGLACRMCRARGKVSIVGSVGLALNRSEIYQKEIDVRISCSYGPGRYDDAYELQGQDYPMAFVRWTENRNLQLFLKLLAEDRMEIGTLVSTQYVIDDYKSAYQAVKDADSKRYGLVFDYKLKDEGLKSAIKRRIDLPPTGVTSPKDDVVNVGLIGVGGYAVNVHVPALKALSNRAHIRALASRTGISTVRLASLSECNYTTTDYHEILEDPEIDAVVVATRHSLHAEIVIQALQAGKHVFVEKPLAVTMSECAEIERVARESQRVVQVGFNRRYAPLLNRLREFVGSEGYRWFKCRVNVGDIGEHWSGRPEEGGRLISEGVHFFDLANWMLGSYPETVRGMSLGNPELTNADMAILLSYPGGSIAQISYVTIGSREMPKERFEFFGNGRSGTLEDFKRLRCYGPGGGSRTPRMERNDKGQREQLHDFLNIVTALETDHRQRPGLTDGIVATAIAHAAVEAARSGNTVRLHKFLKANHIEIISGESE